MSRILTTLAILSILSGCDAERATEVIQLAPLATASMKPAMLEAGASEHAARTEAEPSAKPAPQPKAVKRWSNEPPVAAKMELRLDRDGKRVHLSGDGIDLFFELAPFGECVEEMTQATPPETMPDSEFKERPVWLALQGDEEAASLRLSTRGALFVIDDGCQRVSDVTSTLLGARGDSTDPIFAADPVAPDEAYDADDITLRRKGGTGAVIKRDGKPLLDVKRFSGEVMMTARALEEQRWITLLMAREWEYKSHDGSTGRDHTLAWTLHDRDEPLLVFDNDYRYALDGIDSEQLDVRSTRVFPHDDGLLRASGRRHVDQEMNVELACEETDENVMLEYQRVSETVRWEFHAAGAKKPVKLGVARLRGTFATGCLEDAKKRASKRRKNLTKGAPKTAVRWNAL